MVAHRLSCFSYIFLLANSTYWLPIHFFYRPTQRVGLSFFFSFFFTGQLNVLAVHDFFLPTNSTCWPFMNFFLPANSTCWPFSLFFLFFCWPTQRVGPSYFFLLGQLNVLAYLSTAEWISSALVTRLPTCSGNTSWGVDHWQQQESLITLIRPVPSWRPLAIFSIFGSQW